MKSRVIISPPAAGLSFAPGKFCTGLSSPFNGSKPHEPHPSSSAYHTQNTGRNQCLDRATQSAGPALQHHRGNGALVKQTQFASAAELETTLMLYLKTYNCSIAQRALKHLTPVAALKKWQQEKPELLVKRVYNQPGLDT